MHQIAAPVACVLAGLWLAYLVPYKLRHRQQLLESRADDRYSEALRVVAVTRRERGARALRGGQMVRQVADRAHAGTAGLLTPGRGLVAMATGRTGGDTVDRPHATGEHVTAEAARRAAQVRAARAAASARRAAAARRRAALAVVLLVATAAGWAALGLVPTTPLLAGIVPTLLLALVLVAGRRAVVAGKRNDEAMARQILESEELAANPRSGATKVVVPAVTAASAAVPAAGTAVGAKARSGAAKTQPGGKAASTAQSATTATVKAQSAPTPRVTGRAVHPSEARTEVFAAIVADHGEKGAAARHATGEVPVVASRDAESSSAAAVASLQAAPAAASAATAAEVDEGWAPVPVPRPTYAMKPAAPRREPVALGPLEGSTATRPASAEDLLSVDDVLLTPEPPAELSGSIDLNAVLAKRRAAGE
ncbi:MAG TPA: hypothetical protein VGC04_09420 [Cellulomonas sp.]